MFFLGWSDVMQNKINDSTFLVKKPGFTTTVLPNGNWVFFDEENNKVVVMSATAGIFWELCSGVPDLGELTKQIAALYPDVKATTIRKDVQNIIPQLFQNDLLTMK